MLPIKNADKNYWLTKGITQEWANPAPGYPNGKHNGVDFGTMTGTSIVAAWRGQVVKADYDTGYGRHVRILHPSGELTIYGHLKSIAVVVGQQVEEGTYLGESGGGLEDEQRGQSTGPHLHFEVRSNPYVAASNIDPLAWLERLHADPEPLPRLHGIVRVIAVPWVRIRMAPSLKARIVGQLNTGELLQVADDVEPVMAEQIEWVPLVYWTARSQRGQGEYLEQT